MKDRIGLSLLSERAEVLCAIAAHPQWTVRQIADELGSSERQVFRRLDDLQSAGYLTRVKDGRRNRYALTAAVADQALRAGMRLTDLAGSAALAAR